MIPFFLIHWTLVLFAPFTLGNEVHVNSTPEHKKRRPPTQLEIGVLRSSPCENPVKIYDEVEVIMSIVFSLYFFLDYLDLSPFYNPKNCRSMWS